MKALFSKSTTVNIFNTLVKVTFYEEDDSGCRILKCDATVGVDTIAQLFPRFRKVTNLVGRRMTGEPRNGVNEVRKALDSGSFYEVGNIFKVEKEEATKILKAYRKIDDFEDHNLVAPLKNSLMRVLYKQYRPTWQRQMREALESLDGIGWFNPFEEDGVLIDGEVRKIGSDSYFTQTNDEFILSRVVINGKVVFVAASKEEAGKVAVDYFKDLAWGSPRKLVNLLGAEAVTRWLLGSTYKVLGLEANCFSGWMKELKKAPQAALLPCVIEASISCHLADEMGIPTEDDGNPIHKDGWQQRRLWGLL